MKIVGKAIQILKDINNSKGAQDLSGWIAHGATELANVNMHGHAAPMYTQAGSPPDQQEETEFDKHNREAETRDAKLDRASQGMKSRMDAPQPPREQEMSR
jgi:hypothetical protein